MPIQRLTLSGAMTEVQDQLGGYKARCENLGVPLPLMVVVDNCCTVRNKILVVLLMVLVGLDVFHFKMRCVH